MPTRDTERQHLLETLVNLSTETESGGGGQLVLINGMYDVPLSIVEEYLLQVVHVCFTHNHPEHQQLLRKYLLALASQSLYLALRLSWVIDAINPAFQQLGLGARVAEVVDGIENAAVNRTSAAQDVSSEVLQKPIRCALFSTERSFATMLTNISNALRAVPDRSKRKSELHRMLDEVNDFLSTKRVFFPLACSLDDTRWVARVCIEECKVFSSRERAPFLLVCETLTDASAKLQDPSLSVIARSAGEQLSPLSPSTSPSTAAAAVAAMQSSRGASAKAPSRSSGGSSETDLISQVFGEAMEQKRARIRAASEFGGQSGWDIASIIVKAGDDLRQEELALQLISVFNRIWQQAGLTCCVRPYSAMSTTHNAGLIQCVTDAASIDSLKKAAQVQSLNQFFVRAYGGEDTRAYGAAQRNFAESMAGYSIVCYLLQIKDRHNGNLMVTRAGHVVHIDFGFMLATSPGGIKFESAPFKLSQELVDVMGGINSPCFTYFKVLVYQGFKAAREQADEILALIDLMTPYKTIACFGQDPDAVLAQLRNRFRFDLESDVEFAVYVKELIMNSVDNWRTKRYDQFQQLQNGII